MVVNVQTKRVLALARNIFFIAFVLAVVATGTLWFTLEYKPAWYRHGIDDRLSPRHARMEAVRLVDTISDRLAAQQPVEITLSDRTVTGWLAALPSLLPQSQYTLPDGISEPAVRFDESGLLRIGARADQEGLRAILSVSIRIELVHEKKYLRLALDQVNGGALPLPKFLIEKFLNPLLQSEIVFHVSDHASRSPGTAAVEKVRTVDELFEGVLIPNRFVWPNGDRPFKIDELKFSESLLAIHIQPTL